MKQFYVGLVVVAYALSFFDSISAGQQGASRPVGEYGAHRKSQQGNVILNAGAKLGDAVSAGRTTYKKIAGDKASLARKAAAGTVGVVQSSGHLLVYQPLEALAKGARNAYREAKAVYNKVGASNPQSSSVGTGLRKIGGVVAGGLRAVTHPLWSLKSGFGYGSSTPLSKKNKSGASSTSQAEVTPDVNPFAAESKKAVNATNADGNTNLHTVAGGRGGNIDALEFNLNNGADINARNSAGDTPLHLAARAGDKKAVDLLLRKGARKDIANGQGFIALEKRNINHPENNGLTTLQNLVRGNTAPVEDIQFLLKKGADVNVLDDKGNTPLHTAVSFGNLKTMEHLLDVKGIQLNNQDKDGYTPLQSALKDQKALKDDPQKFRENFNDGSGNYDDKAYSQFKADLPNMIKLLRSKGAN